ncbi:VanZ family protein [Clostridium oceanicum]|uniref:VanZ family protein n=1 Tax=Clostridium oceanicum TaxID=1543 RepID=A0ABN1JJZ8_9CLOT
MLKKSVIFVLSLFLSWALYFFVISEFMIRFMEGSTALSFAVMFFIAFVFYSFTLWVVTRKFNKLHIDILAALYFFIIIGLTFFKTSYSNAAININPFNILREFQQYFAHTLILTISNLFIYLPLGLYIKNKVKVSNKRLFLSWFIYIILVESIQAAAHTGIFDINDIITNTLGFLIGVLLNSLVIKYFSRNSISYMKGLQ